MLKVPITPDDIELAEQFAQTRLEKSENLYKKRGSGSNDKILLDIKTGLLGELAVYRLLNASNKKITKPDLVIYDGKSKNYNGDLTFNKFTLHVKCQTLESAENYGISCLMQRTDKTFSKPQTNHYLVMTVFDDVNMVVKVWGFINIKYIVKNELIGLPRIQWLQRTKIAFYYSEIRQRINWRYLCFDQFKKMAAVKFKKKFY